MWNPNDDGYGSQMLPSEYSGKVGSTASLEELQRMRDADQKASIYMVNGYNNLLDMTDKREYNRMLNGMFEQHVTSDDYNRMLQQQTNNSFNKGNFGMVVRKEPTHADMFRTSTSLCTALSVDKIDDFSSPFQSGGGVGSSGGGYTDYMKAFSQDSLITPHVANAQGNGIMTVEQLERERAQLSHIPSMELLRERNLQEAAEREADMERWRKFKTHDEKIEEHNAAIRNQLSDRSVLQRRNLF